MLVRGDYLLSRDLLPILDHSLSGELNLLFKNFGQIFKILFNIKLNLSVIKVYGWFKLN